MSDETIVLVGGPKHGKTLGWRGGDVFQVARDLHPIVFVETGGAIPQNTKISRGFYRRRRDSCYFDWQGWEA